MREFLSSKPWEQPTVCVGEAPPIAPSTGTSGCACGDFGDPTNKQNNNVVKFNERRAVTG